MGPALIALTAIFAGGCLNFGVVEEGRLYRSGQPDPEELRELAREHGLRTVLNLRGAQPGEDWFEAERAVCAELGVTFTSVRLSARRRPERDEMLALLDVFDRGGWPMLMHCKGGADRTGLAAAVYRIAVRGEPVERAADELFLSYGYLGWLRGTGELSEFLELYEATGGGKTLRRWLLEDYYSK